MKPEKTQQEHHQKILLLTVNSTIVALAAALFFAGKNPSVNNWGISHLAFYSPALQVLIPLLLLLLLLPSVRQFLLKRLEMTVQYFGKQSKTFRRIGALMLLIAMGFLFWTFRTATHFLGDGYGLLIYLRDLGKNGYYLWSTNHEPLMTYFAVLWYKLFSALGRIDPAEISYRAISIVSGILCFIIFWKLTGLIRKERIERVLFFLFFCSTGAIQLFFGYVENYSAAYMGTVFFLFASGSYLQGKMSILIPAIVFPLLVALYFGAIIFLPALLFILWVGIRRKEIKPVLTSTMVTIVLTAGLMWLLGFTPGTIQNMFGEKNDPLVMPLMKLSSPDQAYGLFSMEHGTELLNLLLLVQPVAIVLVVMSGWFRKNQERISEVKIFLTLTIAGGIIFLCTVNAMLGMARDWDALSIFLSSVSIAAVYRWFTEEKENRMRRELLTALTVISMMQTGLWIGVNSEEVSSTKRITLMMENTHGSARGTCNLCEALGNVFWTRKQYVEAAQCYERGLALEPNNSRFLKQLGIMYYAMGENQKAFYIYIKSDSLGCADAVAYSNLGRIYHSMNQFDEALKTYKKGLALDSTMPELHQNIGILLAMYDKAYDAALEHFFTAERLDPNFLNAPLAIGSIYLNQRLYDKSITYYLKALRIDPYNIAAHANLANCYFALKDTVNANKYARLWKQLSHTN